VILIALTAATPAFAQDWRIAAMIEERPDRTIYYIDAASITRSGDTVRFTTQSVVDGLTDDRAFDRSVTRRNGNCRTMSSAIVANTYYANGALLLNDTEPSPAMSHKAGTIIYSLLAQVCGEQPLDATRIDDPEGTARAYFKRVN
jgi:hypothetical protein